MITLEMNFEDGTKRTGKFAVPTVLGRSPQCGIQLAHWRVARQHLRISRAADGFHIDDLGSILGTRVNGVRVTRFGPLRPSDELVVGPCLIKLVEPVAALCSAGSSESTNQSRDAMTAETEHQPHREALLDPAPDLTRSTHYELRQTLQADLIKIFDLRRLDVSRLSDSALRQYAEQCVAELLDQRFSALSPNERNKVIEVVVTETVGLGLIEELLRDDSITEIMVNRFDEIFIERRGVVSRYFDQFTCDQAVRRVVERIVYPLGRRIDELSPMVDARLPDGSRLNAVLAPISIRGTCFTLRKFPCKRLEMEDLILLETLPRAAAELVGLAVRARLNIVVSGGTGSGKTTLLNILAGSVSAQQRMVTIEDCAELQIAHPHVVALEARPSNTEGQGGIAIRDLVRNALRMRPDRIIIGEVRGAEAVDMLAAMNTGHEGSFTTLHANSPREALSRLETMALSADVALPLAAIREQIGSALQLVIQQNRLADGSRKITSITEVSGVESGIVQTQEIAFFDDRRQLLIGSGVQPSFFKRFEGQASVRLMNWLHSA